MTAPILEMHHGIAVVRDDLFPDGTKARFIAQVFEGVKEAAVYASLLFLTRSFTLARGDRPLSAECGLDRLNQSSHRARSSFLVCDVGCARR